MSTTVIEAPAGAEVVVTDAAVTGANWVHRAATKIRNVVKKGWGWLKRAFNWCREKVVAAYNWTADRVVRSARWIREHTRKAASKTKEVAKSSWSWLRSAGAGAWDFTAGFRHWVATPFRLAFGTTAGLGAMLLLGGKVVLILTIPWVAYLMWSGRLQRVDKKYPQVLNPVTGEYEKGTFGDLVIDKDTTTSDLIANLETTSLPLKAQAAMGERMNEIRELGDLSAETGNKTEASELAGRLFLLERRAIGVTASIPVLLKLHRSRMEEVFGGKQASDYFIWNAVKRGMVDEQKLIDAIIAEHSEKVPS